MSGQVSNNGVNFVKIDLKNINLNKEENTQNANKTKLFEHLEDNIEWIGGGTL